MKHLLLFMIAIALMINVFAFDRETIISRLDEDFYALRDQGNTLLTQENAEEAIKYYLRFLDHKRDDQNTLLNSATAFAMLNEPELAGRFLLEAVRNGYDNLDFINSSQHFNRLKEESPVFQKEFEEVETLLQRRKRAMGDITYIEVPMKIRYRTILPNNFDPEKTYTLLIMMHGYGGNHNNFRGLVPSLQETNIIYVTPQAPYPFETIVTREPSFSWNIFDSAFERDNHSEHNTILRNNYILKLTEELKSKYKVNKVFLAGFSQGGFSTLEIGAYNPGVFSGLICFGGGLWDGLPDEEIAKGKATPVLLVHGKQDFVVRYEAATNAEERLKKLGYKVTLHSFEGGHNIPQDAFTKAIEWLSNIK